MYDTRASPSSSFIKSPSSPSDNFDPTENEEGESEVLVEPRFKYLRLLNDISRLTENDAASCFAVHDKYLVIGSHSGRIYLFDHLGNKHMESTARHHKCAVSCITIEKSGNYLISCANDFTVSIYGIGGSDEYNQKITLKSSPKAVAISPDFSRSGSGQKFVVGTNNLILCERNLIGRRETVLYQGLERDGQISTITWHESYVAFTNETGTRIYNIKLRKMITLIQPIHRVEPSHANKFPPKHAWLNSSTIAIGWANTVCICGIFAADASGTNRRGSSMSGNPEIHSHFGRILHRLTIAGTGSSQENSVHPSPNFFIAGISFTTSGFDEDDDVFTDTTTNQVGVVSLTQRGKQPSMLHLSESHGSFLRTASTATLCSQNSSQNGGGSHALNNKPQWKELVLFGIQIENDQEEDATKDVGTSSSVITDDSKSSVSEKSNATKTFSELSSSSASAHKCTAQLLLIIPSEIQEYQLVAEDTIEMRQTELRHFHRFSMGALVLDNVYYLMGPKEIIEAQPCSVDDRVNWLLENELYANALELTMKKSDRLREVDPLEVGKRYVRHLIEQKDFDKAASLLPQICHRRKDEWETYVNEFEHCGHILKLAPVIPTKELKLEPECYEAILKAALYARPKLFRGIVGRWDGELYRTPSVIDFTIRRITEDGPRLDRDECAELSRALAQLYVYNHQFEKAIRIYMTLRDQTVFGVINRHKLFTMVKDKIVDLMNISADQAIRLLLDNEDLIPSPQVVSQLGRVPRLQMAYLQRLQARGEGLEHSNKLLQLLADCDRPSLLPFLRKNEHYMLDIALEVCKQRSFTEEVIFLLGKSGNRLSALELIIISLGKIDMAIDFCSEHDDDPELWQRLVDLAMTRSEYISRLLAMAGTFVDPLGLIEKIPSEMKIPHLKKCLLKVLRDYRLHIKLLKQSLAVSVSDLAALFSEEQRNVSFAILDSGDPNENRCHFCRSPLIVSTVKSDSKITNENVQGIIYASGNRYHDQCFHNASVT